MHRLTHTGRRKILFIFGPGILLNDHVWNEHNSAVYCETIEKSKIFKISNGEMTLNWNQITEIAEQIIKKLLDDNVNIQEEKHSNTERIEIGGISG